MKSFNPNESARNRLTLWTQPVQITCELTEVNHEVWEQLCRDWLQVYRVEFVGGPKCGWVWTMDDAPDDVWSYPAGRVVHSYCLCGDRYVYCGARAI